MIFFNFFFKKEGDVGGRPGVSYLHLLKVADSLDGQFAPDSCGRVPGLQLDDALGSLFQAFQAGFEVIQLLLLVLQERSYLSGEAATVYGRKQPKS